ncbi:hypothetical protein RUA4292_00032 [Ruegeria atlantica]|uniref:Uncharacterized protein n=1 Tax=Ruegeria atlantica TaxID=81569 RepID=A0A0P1E9J0_9RHOB|nr:hypothetical protein RUA4292_00032 [Ruegeria atlantica]
MEKAPEIGKRARVANLARTTEEASDSSGLTLPIAKLNCLHCLP